MIYKLLRPDEWAAFRELGRFEGSSVDRADGFIHFSTAAQVRETAAKHFPDANELVLAEIDPALLASAPVWEPSRGGALFPHLYAVLPFSAVVRSWIVYRHVFPEELP